MSLRNRLAGWVPTLMIARRNIGRAKARSALAALAILIGVVAIGAIGAGGAAFKQSQLDLAREQGANNVYVSPGFEKEDQYFDREDVLAIRETVGSAGVVATKRTTRQWRTRTEGRIDVSVTYIEDPRAIHAVAGGEIPTNWRRNVVVSHSFAEDHRLAVGDRITLLDTSDGTETERTYRVVAVLAESQAFGVSDVYLPLEEAPDRRYDRIRITTQSVDRAETVAAALRDRFNDRKDRLLVFELTALVRLFKAFVNGINGFLAGLASISLLVAGVSIANTMLMATIRRREEIGVLRAVGYTKADVIRLLLVEALLLGAIGAAVGTLIAIGVTVVANTVFLGAPFAFTTDAVLYLVGGVAFGLFVSLIGGVYPAWRAANRPPVEALRS